MKKIILLFLLFAGFFASAQTVVDPHTFPQETNPNNSNFEFYSRALGSNKRATFNNVRKNMSPGIVAVGFTPSPSGNTTNFGDFVLDPSDALWYIAYSGDAVQLPYNTPFSAGTGISISGGNVITNTGDLSNTNELQTLSIAGQNLTLSNGGGTVTIPAGAIYTAGTGITILSNVVTNTGDLSATNEGLLSVSPGTDTTAIINSNTSGSPSLTILVRGGLSIDETGNTIILEGGAGDGVSSVTGTDGNGFDITVVNPTTAPEISIATTVTGITYGSLGELDAVTVGYGLDFTAPTLRVDTSEVATPYDLSLIDRGFVSTSDGTSHTVTLTPGGGSFKLVEGSNITLTTSGTADDGIITIASTGGSGTTDLTFSGTSSPVTLNSSSGTDVTFTAGGINTFSATGTNITITATEVDGSVTNEAQTLSVSGTSTGIVSLNAISGTGGGTATFAAAGINSISQLGGTITITGTEVDGALANEGLLGVGAGSGTSSVLLSNTTGATGVTINASTGLSIAESTSSNGGSITITNSAPDQTVVLTEGGIVDITGTYPNFTISATEAQTLYTDDRTGTDWTIGITPGNTLTLDVFTSTLSGLTPASGGGTTNYLRADGTWAAPPGSGGISEPAGQVVVGTGSGADSYPEMKYLTTPNDLQLLNTSGANNANISIRTTDTTGVATIYQNATSVTTPHINLRGNGEYLLQVQKDSRSTDATNLNFTRILGGSGSGAGDNNQVMMLGFNQTPGGGLEDATKPSISYRIEEHYRTTGSAPFSYECHLPDIRMTNGSFRRPLSGLFQKDSTSSGFAGSWSFSNDHISFSDYKTFTQKVTWGFATNGAYPKGISFIDTAQIRFATNNTQTLSQRNAANSAYVNMFKVDNSDRVFIGGGGESGVASFNRLQITNNGDLWNENNAINIGKSGNLTRLNIYSPDAVIMQWGKTYGSNEFSMRLDGNDWVVQKPTLGNYAMFFDTRAADYSFRIEQDGDMGLLTYNPQARLHIFTASGATRRMLQFENSTGSSAFYRSNATPEGAVTGNPGDLCQTNISGAGNLYVKKTGTGNTGWDVPSFGLQDNSIRSYRLTRTLPAAGSTVNIGYVSAAGAGTMYIEIIAIVNNGGSGSAISKKFMFPAIFNATGGAWQVLNPIASTGAYSGNDFNIEGKSSSTGDSLRIRSLSGTALGDVEVTLLFYSWIDGIHAFTSSSATATPTAVTATYSQTAISNVKNKVGVNVAAPAEALHVSGNVRFSGALMPNNAAGTSGQILQSAGAGSPPTWVNQSTITGVNIYNTDGSLTGNRTVTLGSNSIKFLTSNSLGTYPGLISQTYNDGTDNNPYFTGKDHLSTDRFYITGEGTDVRVRSINGGLRMAANSSVYLTAGSPSKTLEWKDTGVAVFPSSSPSSPAGGSVWYSSAQKLSYRESSSTRTVASIEGDITGSALQLVTSNNTPGGSDNLTYRFDANAGSFTVTLDNTLSEGRWYTMRCTRNGTNTITFNAGSGYSLAIDGSSTLTPLSFVAGASGTGIEAPYRIYTVRRMDTVIYIK